MAFLKYQLHTMFYQKSINRNLSQKSQKKLNKKVNIIIKLRDFSFHLGPEIVYIDEFNIEKKYSMGWHIIHYI